MLASKCRFHYNPAERRRLIENGLALGCSPPLTTHLREDGLVTGAGAFTSCFEAISPVPLYDYQCANGHRFEVRQNFNDEALTVCQVCGEATRRVIHPVGIVFKGSGFYATDSRTSRAKAEGSTATVDGADGSAKTETPEKSTSSDKAEGKPATPNEKKSDGGSASKAEKSGETKAET